MQGMASRKQAVGYVSATVPEHAERVAARWPARWWRCTGRIRTHPARAVQFLVIVLSCRASIVRWVVRARCKPAASRVLEVSVVSTSRTHGAPHVAFTRRARSCRP